MTNEEKAVLGVFESEGIDRFASSPVEKLPVTLERHMPQGTKSAVVFLVPYFVRDDGPRNISRYAVSRDYHKYFGLLGEKAKEAFSDIGSPCFAKVMSDLSPLDEKSSALLLGLGVRGKNRLLINAKYGSYVFIGAVFSDADLSLFSDGLVSPNGECMGCGRCERACPTFLSGGGACFSELTQKKRLDEEDEELLTECVKNSVWGCDICQEVCPHNKDIAETPVRFFHEARIPYITTELLDSMTDVEFAERAYAWRGRKVIGRNVLKSFAFR